MSILYSGISIPINYMIGSYPVSALYSGQTQIWSAKKAAPFAKVEGNWVQAVNVFTSNKIGASQSTIEKVYFKNLGGQTITITYDVDSDKNNDYLTIFALDSETEIIATSKANGTANGTYGKIGSVDFTFPDNEEHFICFKYSKNAYTDSGRDNAIVTFPEELFGETKWVIVGEVIRYEYEDENDTLYKCIYQDLQQTIDGILTTAHNDGELISKEPTTGDIISPNDTIILNDTPYGVAVPEVDPDVVYRLSFNNPILVIFNTPVKVKSLKFNGKNLIEIRGLNLVDTSNVTSMAGVFNGCKELTSLDLSNFDTSNATSMISMFYCCSGLTSLDLSNFDTSKVTNMGNMFSGCSGLTSLNLSGWDTSKVTDMSYMFNGCNALTTLNLSGWIFPNNASMTFMFSTCNALTTIIGPITGITQSISFNYSPLLIHDSAMVILNGLETVTETKTVTFKSTTYGTLTEAEIAAATAKGWTIHSAA